MTRMTVTQKLARAEEELKQADMRQKVAEGRIKTLQEEIRRLSAFESKNLKLEEEVHWLKNLINVLTTLSAAQER